MLIEIDIFTKSIYHNDIEQYALFYLWPVWIFSDFTLTLIVNGEKNVAEANEGELQKHIYLMPKPIIKLFPKVKICNIFTLYAVLNYLCFNMK